MDKLEELALQVSPEAATEAFVRKCQGLFNKVAGLRRVTLLKMRLWHRRVPVNFVKFLRTSLSQNTSWRLLLYAI